jgi:hypothetical protein
MNIARPPMPSEYCRRGKVFPMGSNARVITPRTGVWNDFEVNLCPNTEIPLSPSSLMVLFKKSTRTLRGSERMISVDGEASLIIIPGNPAPVPMSTSGVGQRPFISLCRIRQSA